MKLGKYQHYKGNFYDVIGLAIESETMEEVVVYRALYKNEDGKSTLWVRPKKSFFETVIVEGKEVLRFIFIDN
jgi:hypothetical protein